jgi:uncharacterized protein YceK
MSGDEQCHYVVAIKTASNEKGITEVKNVLTIILIASLFILISGCGSALKEINAKSLSTRSDIFAETEGCEPVPAGYADLVIAVSIKTALAGYYVLESKRSLSGKPGLPFILNIDGQAVIWKMDGQKEITSTYNEKGMRIPDGGEGMRYLLQKKIMLTLGPHRVFFGFPQDECIREFDILLKRGISGLDIKPLYRQDSRRSRSFLNGLSDFEVFYNGDMILHDIR